MTEELNRLISSVRLAANQREPGNLPGTDAKTLVWTTLEIALKLAIAIEPQAEVEEACHALLDALQADVAVAKAAAAQSHGRPPCADYELTLREQGIMHFIVRGHSNKQIARELGIGPETVKTHISKILVKLDVRNRVQAAAFVHRHGLIKAAGADIEHAH